MSPGFMDGYKTYEGPRGNPKSWRAAFFARMGIGEAKERVGQDSPYEILGVSSSATWAEIKSAYRQRSMACHLDRAVQNGMTVEAATEAFKRVVAAYTVLEDKYGKGK